MKKRIHLLDYLRGFAVFTMVMQHAMLIYAPQHSEKHWLGLLFLLLGTAPAAPVFMVIMGYFTVQSKKQSVLPLVKRGLFLILSGYILNAVRFPLPFLDRNSAIELLLEIDIFQLAGLSMVLMAPLRKGIHSPLPLLLLAAVLFIVSPFLWGIAPGQRGLDILWGTGENVSFPLFPWFAYPLIGMALGLWMKDRDSFPIGALLLAAPILFLAAVLSWRFFPVGDYYRSGFSVHLLILGFLSLWFCLWQYLDKKIPSESRLFRLFSFWSRFLTPFYIIQWILIGWGLVFLGDGEQDSVNAACIGLGVLVLTHFIVRLYQKIRSAEHD